MVGNDILLYLLGGRGVVSKEEPETVCPSFHQGREPSGRGKESSGQNHMNCIAKESAFGLVDFMDALPISFIDFSCNFFVIYFLRLTLDLIGSLFSSFLRRKRRLLILSSFPIWCLTKGWGE